MLENLRESPLFAGMSDAEIQGCLSCSKSKIAAYDRDAMIFSQDDPPEKLWVLLEGAVVVGSDSKDGRRIIVATFDTPGELFGEVFLFLNRRTYDHYAQAASPVRVLQIPREFLSHTCGQNCGCHAKLIANMLSILARKAYFLNRRLQVLSCATLRQKIALALLQSAADGGGAALAMNREVLADYLNAARPSVSRELMRMQEDGLLTVDKRRVVIRPERLRALF